MSRDETELFGTAITQSTRLTLTEQVYDILLEEIQRGRWQVGSRLPSITDLAHQSGVSRAPIQHAFDMLAEAGYVRQESRRGTFLASLLPMGRESVGVIGVALLRQSASSVDPDPGRGLLLHRLMELLSERNYLVEVQYLPPDYDWQSLPTRGGAFSPRVRGIISLHPFQHLSLVRAEEDHREIPLVFLGTISPGSLPCASGNNLIGGYLLTQRLIELGHRKIVVFSKNAPIEFSQQRFLDGHRQAMISAGLQVNQQAIEESMGVELLDLSGYRRFLERHADATAIIAMMEPAAQAIASVARMLGLSIPHDISLVCQGRVSMTPEDAHTILYSVEYPSETVVKMALDMLEEMLRTGRCEISQVLTMPQIYEGSTIGPPREAQQPLRLEEKFAPRAGH